MQSVAVGWYALDSERGRPTNPACMPVGPVAARYQLTFFAGGMVQLPFRIDGSVSCGQ
jgi:hypothetical protein